MRMMFLSFPSDARASVTGVLEEWKDLNWSTIDTMDNQIDVRVVLPDSDSQKLVDRLQARLSPYKSWKLVIVPVEACITPKSETSDISKHEGDDKKEKSPEVALREEIYQDVAEGAKIDSSFLVLTFLSAIVAAIGMNASNIAVVIGAMVIAPLLGPLLAFSFASALGDAQLMLKSARTALCGLALGFVTALAIGFIIDVDFDSTELIERTNIGLDSVALALASGGAAALSVTRGLPSTLVGVMVAVALLPPSVAMAVYLGAGEFTLSARAGILLATNIICVNIASLLVFALRGIRPRTWLERRSAKRSRQINLAVWGTLLAGLIVLIVMVLT